MDVIDKLTDNECAAAYAKYRPSYPPKIKTIIVTYAKKEQFCFDGALDVACGSGQATFIFTDVFKQIHGIDCNQAHLDQIQNKSDNVTFSCGYAEQLNFADNSIDLITIAQGLRFVDIDKFYAEVKRVLRPGGVLAAFGHHYNALSLDKVEANMALYEFDKEVLQKNDCWLPGARLEDNNYQDFEFPLRKCERIIKYETIRDWTVSDIVGLIRTTSAGLLYRSKYPSSDAFDKLQDRLSAIYKDKQPIVTMPIFLLMGRK